MVITASLVKELRERTGSGMMECKRALVESQGDIEAAVEFMRKSGAAKADKKAQRIASDGAIFVSINDSGHLAAILEMNSETDFVAKDDHFQSFSDQVMQVIMAEKPDSLETLKALVLSSGQSIEEARHALIAKVGENIQIRRFQILESAHTLAFYRHGTRIGALVESDIDADTTRDIAMHIVAENPRFIDESRMPADVIEKEKAILAAQVQSDNKPAEIVEKMIQGRFDKFLTEVTLLKQAFIKDREQTVAQLVSKAGGTVFSFIRYEVGEGIEKKVEDFAAEVASQLQR